MTRIGDAARAAYVALGPLTNVTDDDSVLIVADKSGMIENEEIVKCLFGLAQQVGAEVNLIVMEDVDKGASQTDLPDTVVEGLHSCDVVIGITLTTIAPVTHHELPLKLMDEGSLRACYMAKRSFETLTSKVALEADYQEMVEIGDKIVDVLNEGKEAHVESEIGSDFTMNIEEIPAFHTNLAHEPGGTPFTWGEALTAPTVGTTEGIAAIDGSILEYGTPNSPIYIEMESGEATKIYGDTPIADDLFEVVQNNPNAGNVCELAFGINRLAFESDSNDANIEKKALGYIHIAIGSGLSYGQDVDSPVHIDLMMKNATVSIDGDTILKDNEMLI